jgi:glycerophosphoryl diester phosphodiesterase
MKRILKSCLPFVLAAGLVFPFSPGVSAAEATPEWTRYPLIAHALGGIDGVDYTNSLQAFAQNYDKGQRVFEMDLLLTEDGQLAGRHDWQSYLSDKLKQPIPQDKQDEPLTMKEFKSYKILDKYTPLSFNDVARILKKHPDVYFITDTKETDPELIKQQFTIIRDTANKVDPTILDRLIPEIYTPEMMDLVKGIIPFKNVIFSIYLSPLLPDEIVKYVQENQIRVVAMPAERVEDKFIADLNNVGAVSYVHSLNKVNDVRQMLAKGVHGVYTDFLSYKDMGIDPTPLYAAGKPAKDKKAEAQIAAAASLNNQNVAQAAPTGIWDKLKNIFTGMIIALS